MDTPQTPAAAPAVSPGGRSALLTVWSGQAQLALGILLGVAGTLIFSHVHGSWRGASRPTELVRGSPNRYRIDLNRAQRAELLQLPGVGATLVERVEDYRREHGPFRSVEDLGKVHGIGPATLERLRPWLYVRAEPGEPDDGATPALTPRAAAPKPAGKKAEALTQPIDVNRASGEELQRLPGIGPKLSQRIVEERQKGPFKTVDDLRRVYGIGPKTLERLRPHVVVGSSDMSTAQIN